MSEDKDKRIFIQEQIRRKPFYKQKAFQKTMRAIGMTAIFGASFGLMFAVAHPLALKYFGEPTKMIVVNETEVSEGDNPLELQLGQVDTGHEVDIDVLGSQQQVYSELLKTGELLESSMVTVICLNGELDLFSHMDENADKTAGVIFTKDQNNLWILTCADIFADANEIKVTFSNGLLADAKVQGIDSVTNLAVLKVSMDEIPKGIRDEVEPAIFGNSNKLQIGDLIISVGVDYMSFGMVTSRTDQDFCDGSYSMLRTNIVDQMEIGGVLINLQGQVVGILPTGKNTQNTTLQGFGITEIQHLIEGIFNGKEFAYFGIEGKEVTDILAQELSMPKGVYVTHVKESSPAMKKGVQVMDIISSINGQEIADMDDYMEIIRASRPEEELKIKLYRRVLDKYEEITMNVTLGER